MCAHDFQDGVAAFRIEAGADPREIDRCANKRFANGTAVGIEIVCVALTINEADRAIGISVVRELRRQYFAVSNSFSVLPDFFVDNDKAIVLPNIEYEIHVPGKDSGEIHDQFVRNAGVLACLEQRGLDHAMAVRDSRLDRMIDLRNSESVFLFRYNDRLDFANASTN